MIKRNKVGYVDKPHLREYGSSILRDPETGKLVKVISSAGARRRRALLARRLTNEGR